MTTSKYILNADHSIRQTTDLLEWAKWYETADRRVCETMLGEVRISTVFLSLPGPLLFETMVFGGAMDREEKQYSTWDEAVVGHERMVERVKSTITEAEEVTR